VRHGFEQDGATGTAADGLVDGPPDGGWQRYQHDLGAVAAHAQHPVAVLLAKVGNVRAGGFEDPQAEQHEHRDEREVAGRRRLAGRGQQSLELHDRLSAPGAKLGASPPQPPAPPRRNEGPSWSDQVAS
jgi:hypothetical protein